MCITREVIKTAMTSLILFAYIIIYPLVLMSLKSILESKIDIIIIVVMLSLGFLAWIYTNILLSLIVYGGVDNE